MENSAIHKAAEVLRCAEETDQVCEPIRHMLTEKEADSAYLIQELNTQFFIKQGRQIVGRKIGLTSEAVQKQLGVDQPDYGILYADMSRNVGEEITISDVMQPKIEAEIAFVLKEDLNQEVNTSVDVIAAIDYVAPALEIVGSRIKNWDIKLADTIADNGSSGLFVLGEAQCSLDQIDLAKCEMELRLANEGIAEKVSTGSGAACMGNPLNAVLWLANTLALTAYPLRAGDIILSGALGPMVAVNSGDQVEAHISGLGFVSARFSA